MTRPLLSLFRIMMRKITVIRSEISWVVLWKQSWVKGFENRRWSLSLERHQNLRFSHHSYTAQKLKFEDKFKCLGIKCLGISNDLKWETHIIKRLKKAQQRLFSLRTLKSLRLGSAVLVKIYRAVVESVLTLSITVWCSAANAGDKKKPDRVVRTASRITGVDLPSVASIYNSRVEQKAMSIVRALLIRPITNSSCCGLEKGTDPWQHWANAIRHLSTPLPSGRSTKVQSKSSHGFLVLSMYWCLSLDNVTFYIFPFDLRSQKNDCNLYSQENVALVE